MREVRVRARVALDARTALARLTTSAWHGRLDGDALTVTTGKRSATPGAPAEPATPLDIESPPGIEAVPGRPVSPAGPAGVGSDDDRLSEWALPFRGGTVRWRQREWTPAAPADVSSAAPGIAFEQVDGDFAALSGAWNLLPGPDDASCEVGFEARFDLGVPMYDRVVEPLLARVLARAVRAVLAAAYGHVETEEDPPTIPAPERQVAAALSAAR
ncbi:SRPBCC family protein [Sphaerisporangium rhizosphaerae]|uniref:SRPBCC family protein n=1 Tax=Sphaerisporangium rhizosphaerae TaxID=2269375 RepID=A0ABW2PCW6_9ACTN